MEKVNVAVVGCGVISSIYLENLTTKFQDIEVVAVSDLVEEYAQKQAATYSIPQIMSFEEILADYTIQLVVILSTPLFHYEMCKRSIEAGKHTYVEKPLAIETKEAEELVSLATENHVLLGGAPDTFLGAGLQTARKIIDSGVLGTIIACNAFFTCPGHERWHPNPSFYYKKGAGPVFDMGPYYLTALVSLLGSVEEVCSFTSCARNTRKIESLPRKGEIIDVEVDTTMCGILQFTNGTIANIMMSFDIEATNLPYIEIYGTKGSMSVPDPNYFEGPVKVRNRFSDTFMEIPLVFPNSDNSRGLGVEDMVQAILHGSSLRPNCMLQTHIVEVMNALHNRHSETKVIHMNSRVERPEMMPE